MLDFIKNTYDCCGCTACYSVCPKHCIVMEEDERGFFYPKADLDSCAHCGLCESVCPILHYGRIGKPGFQKQHAAAAISNDRETWLRSTSGGAFTEICKTFASMRKGRDVYVFGAAFEGFRVRHVGCKMPRIEPFQKSKYVQSDLGSIFSEIRALLKEGNSVIFSGTPCQAAGLKSYLNSDYEELFFIDFICHGVGSPKVFRQYLAEAGEKNKIAGYQFRVKKKKLGFYERYQSKISYADGNEKTIVKDDYNQLFLNQLCLRDSCGEHCRFRTSRRLGDLTIADFNGFNQVFPEKKDARGYSTVIVNTQKGEDVFEKLGERMTLYGCGMKDIEKWNALFFRTSPENPQRENFFTDFAEGARISDLRKKYVRKDSRRVWNWIKEHIPYTVKFYIKRILRFAGGR